MSLRIGFVASIVLYLSVIAHGQSMANLVAQLREAPTEVDRLTILSDEDFLFDFLNATTGVTTGAAGHTVAASSENFPAVVNNGVSMTVGFLGPCGMNTPHTHPRATEINFSLNTTLRAGFLMENGARFIDVEIAPGSAAVFPQGAIHFEMNPSCEPAMFVAAFNNEDPGVSQVAQRYFGLPSDIVGATLNGLGVVEVEGLESKIPDNVALGVESCLQRCNITRGDQPTLQLQPSASSVVLTSSASTLLPSSSSLPPVTSEVPSASTVIVNSGAPTSSLSIIASSSSVTASTYLSTAIYSTPTLSIAPSNTYSPSALPSISQSVYSSPSIYSTIYSYSYSSAPAANSYYSSSATVSSYSKKSTTTALTSSFWTFSPSATKSAVLSSFSSSSSAASTSNRLTPSSSPFPTILSSSIASPSSSVISSSIFSLSSSSSVIPTSSPLSSHSATESASSILSTSSPTSAGIPISSPVVSFTVSSSRGISGTASSSVSASSAKPSSSASFSTASTSSLPSSVAPSTSIGSSVVPSTTTIIVPGPSVAPTDAVSQQAPSSTILSSASSFPPIPSVFLTHTLSWETTLIPTASSASSSALVGRLVRRSDARLTKDSSPSQYVRSITSHVSLNPVIIALISVNSVLFMVLVVALFFWIRRRNRRAAHRAHQYVLPVRAPHIPPKDYRYGFDTDETTAHDIYSSVYPSTVRYSPRF